MDLNKNLFHQKYHNLRKTINDELFKNFSNLSNDSERFKFINNLKNIDFNFGEKNYGKNLDESLKLKKIGNDFFQKKQWLNALESYNQSYLATPGDCVNETAIILANRSAALYHMDKFDLALNDIERVFTMKCYPKEMEYKLKERLARCYLGKKEYQKAIDAFKSTIQSLDYAKNLSQDKSLKYERDAQLMIMLLEKNDKTVKTVNKNEKIKPNSMENLLNKNIEFDYNENEGRFVKAKDNIKIGELILIEKPHCSVLLDKYSKTHCQNCFKRTALTPISCPNCNDVIFCTEKCQQDALKNFHQHECGILKTFWQFEVSITCHLAMRIISQKSIDYFLNIKNELQENDNNFESVKNFKNEDYRKVYNLVRHEAKRSFDDFFQRTVMANFLYKCLRAGNYFNNNESNENINYIGGLLLRNLQFLQFNAHEISELEKESPTDIGQSMFIGGAVYPTLAMFNHSCDPSIGRYYQGNSVCVYAVKNINDDEVIGENYGPIFTQMVFRERQSQLNDQYWFDCHCKACSENWPLFDEMKNEVIRFRCDSGKKCTNVIEIPININEFMVKCISCGEFTNILKGLKALQDTDSLFKSAKRLQESGKAIKALTNYIEMLKLLDDTMAPPFRDYHLCQQGIRSCFLEMGNRYIKNELNKPADTITL